MKEFPSYLKPENKEKFSEYNYQNNISNMRKELVDLILSRNENNYFELDSFRNRHSINKSDMEKMCETVSFELKNIGWNIATSFGGTGLFVYSTPNPPKSCYKDEF